jgi:hypothetical protein
MRMNFPQLAAALRTTRQSGNLRLVYLLHLRQFPIHKLALAALAPVALPTRLCVDPSNQAAGASIVFASQPSYILPPISDKSFFTCIFQDVWPYLNFYF